jgi:hypothetical protein
LYWTPSESFGRFHFSPDKHGDERMQRIRIKPPDNFPLFVSIRSEQLFRCTNPLFHAYPRGNQQQLIGICPRGGQYV